MLDGYCKPLNYGHKFLDGLLEGEVVVQEKIDGSQFSFGVIDGELHCRSRRVPVIPHDPGMFDKAVNTAVDLYQKGLLKEGWVYRGEYLRNPKHNTLHYKQVPPQHIILFDIEIGMQAFVAPDVLQEEADRLGLWSVPVYYNGRTDNIRWNDKLPQWLEQDSILGGVKIEGVVIKNYNKLGADGKVLMGKYVSDDFKETHNKDWKERNPSKSDVIDNLIDRLATEARWRKAVQHLRENNELVNAPQDIGPLMKEINRDIEEEEQELIKDILYKHYIKDIKRGVVKGFPEWYKSQIGE